MVHSGNCVEFRGKCETLMSMCVALLAGAVEGFWRRLSRILQGRPSGEKGLKAVRKDVIVETGMDIFAVLLFCSRSLLLSWVAPAGWVLEYEELDIL